MPNGNRTKVTIGEGDSLPYIMAMALIFNTRFEAALKRARPSEWGMF